MEQIKERVSLICPGYFADYAEREGVPLKAVLDMAGVRTYCEDMTVKAVDGYRESFKKEET
jgi:DMSO/TMAO reductase YedYZ molybdopterin-dependent catalytic subunit